MLCTSNDAGRPRGPLSTNHEQPVEGVSEKGAADQFSGAVACDARSSGGVEHCDRVSLHLQRRSVMFCKSFKADFDLGLAKCEVVRVARDGLGLVLGPHGQAHVPHRPAVTEVLNRFSTSLSSPTHLLKSKWVGGTD